MTDMILGSAQGAVGSLLGRLTSALAKEAQLLSGIRADVQFIKDEMESMNGFLLDMAEANDNNNDKDAADDHRCLAWVKQVAEVAYASQNCIDLYLRSNENPTLYDDSIIQQQEIFY
uniref:Disease resistance N-terminal domain-containing protein n=1 Tax=Leersia perrieri TaxID=77586 RepID=A0A0D9W3V2_9ORYZ